jgi:hypothetical protein
MSFVSANDHPNPISPQDPLYYAPRSVRSIADPRSSSMQQTRSDSLPAASSLSGFDEMREQGIAKKSLLRWIPNSFTNAVHHAHCLPLLAELP